MIVDLDTPDQFLKIIFEKGKIIDKLSLIASNPYSLVPGIIRPFIYPEENSKLPLSLNFLTVKTQYGSICYQYPQLLLMKILVEIILFTVKMPCHAIWMTRPPG